MITCYAFFVKVFRRLYNTSQTRNLAKTDIFQGRPPSSFHPDLSSLPLLASVRSPFTHAPNHTYYYRSHIHTKPVQSNLQRKMIYGCSTAKLYV